MSPPRATAGFLLLALVAATLLLAGSPSALAQSSPRPEPWPMIDGNVDARFEQLDRHVEVTFRARMGSGAETASATLAWTARWVSSHPDGDLYLAFRWQDDTHDNEWTPGIGPRRVDGISIYFDDDGDGVQRLGEDAKTLFAVDRSSWYVDQHTSADFASDQVGDGIGRVRYDHRTRHYTAELLIPAADDRLQQDGTKTPRTRFAVLLWDAARFADAAANVAVSHGPTGTGAPTADWPSLPARPRTSTAPAPRPPAGLGGTIAFVVDRPGASDIHLYDVATGTFTQVTSDATYKRGVSLSHDRTRVAFHSAASEQDYAGYEIEVIGVDGSGRAQLTDNQLLDGHPGWSPDDQELVYATFGSADTSQLVIADATTGAVRRRLSPPGVRDNDADYLPDGRLVFKTDRFSQFPEQRIAVMDSDGRNVMPLGGAAGTSDHDPVGTAHAVVFERFMRDTHYANDPTFMFAPFDIVESPTNGGAERTIVADGWVNWLPVYSPDGNYIAYLRSVRGYTELRLMTRDGEQLGRLLPGVTNIQYFDWK